ncbi:hypothetical protein B14911_10667 [Bacillus sp. NRRL B-14911]|nr:hypothetical protein B14911_10667 [Bacillus sp. NRRL B-14911]
MKPNMLKGFFVFLREEVKSFEKGCLKCSISQTNQPGE